MYVALSPSKDVLVSESGILAYIEVEALSQGIPEISFEPDIINVLTADGQTFELKLR